MSRITALWTAGAVAVLFALLAGAVVLRPILSVDASDPTTGNQTTISSESQSVREPGWYEDDDDGWEDDDYQTDERDGYEDHNEAEHDDDD